MSKPLQFLHLPLFLAAAAVFVNVVRPSFTHGQTAQSASAAKLVPVANLTGAIGPAGANFIDKAISTANERQAEMLCSASTPPAAWSPACAR